MAKKSVVVLGAGFGGLRAAMSIAKKLRRLGLLEKYEVVLVDRNDCHLYTPLLYKVAAGPDGSYEEKCTYAISDLVKTFPIRFIQSEIASVDLPNGKVTLKNAGGANSEQLQADYLVVALGSETNYFGIAGLKENSLPLKSVENAIAIRGALEKAFAKSGAINIVAGGAGPNGIELAAEIRGWADRAEEEDRNLHVSVSIVEALPTILTGLAPQAAALAWNRLEKIGVAVTLNAKIVGVSASEISIDGGEKIPFDLFIWSGGIKAPDMVAQLPMEKDARGSKPLAKDDMACAPGTPDLKIAPMVYGLGDNVCFMNPKTGKPVPAVARAAILQGDIVARNIIEEIKKSESISAGATSSYKPSPKTYRPSNYPYVIPVGENWAVAKIGPIVFAGWFGQLFEKLVALNYLLSIMPFEDAFKAWKKM